MPDKRIYPFQTPKTIPTSGHWSLFRVSFRHLSLFIRVLPYESEVNLTNFYLSWENGEVLWGQMCWTFIHTKKEEKSKKIGTCKRIHTCVYAITWGWGQICPPLAWIGLSILLLLPNDMFILASALGYYPHQLPRGNPMLPMLSWCYHRLPHGNPMLPMLSW